ncbi:MAG TPA: ImcF-related family protein, partial [Nannocystaceae bacterium]|nr:ImcF-related family protein [Nannocystaceae bacterium]
DAGEPLARAAARARELAADLAVRPPVVLACTHLDRLAGIGEFCDGLTTIDRPLGATLPACDTPDALHAALRARLAEPRAWIHQRAHALLARGPQNPAQARLYAFWQHFDALLDRAATTITRLVAHPLPGGETLRLRSIYALAPVTAPAETRWLDDLAQRAGGTYPSDPGAPLPPQLFVRDLFETELHRDAPLATRLRPFLWRRASLQALLAVAAAGLAVYTARAVLHAASVQEDAMQATLDAALPAPLVPALRPLAAKELQDLHRAVAHWQREPEPGTDWGPFRGDRLDPPTRTLYTRAVCQGLIHPLATRTEALLRQRVDSHPGASIPSPSTRQLIDDDLHFYTLAHRLADPRAACNIADEQTWFIGQVQRRWADLAPDLAAADDATTQALQHFVDFADASACGDLPWKSDVAARAQDVLRRAPREEQMVDELIATLNGRSDLDDIRLDGKSLLSGDPVHRAFTRSGWEAAREAISKSADDKGGSTCHLGNADSGKKADYCTRIRNRYVDRYKREWARSIKALSIVRGVDLTLLDNRLDDLLRDKVPNDPLGSVFAHVKLHTQGLPEITCGQPSGDESTDTSGSWWIPKSPQKSDSQKPAIATDLADHFAPLLAYGAPQDPTPAMKGAPSSLPLDDYHAHLGKLREILKTAADDPQTCAQEARTRRDQIVQQIERGNHHPWTEALKDLLLPPFNFTIEQCDDEAARSLNQRWCAEVIAPMTQSLVGRYPFVKESRESASVSEISRIFAPSDGAIAKFRDQYLASRLDIGNIEVRAHATAPGQGRRLNPDLVTFLGDARALEHLLFDFESGQLSVDFSVRMDCAQNDDAQRNEISKIRLKLSESAEDQREFICSAKYNTQPIRWPGKLKESDDAVFDFVGRNDIHVSTDAKNRIVEHGVFGFFRILERRVPPRREANDVVATLHTLKFGDVVVRIKPSLRLAGSIFFGLDPKGQTYLAPLRTRTIVRPPQQLFADISYTCENSHELGLE